MAAEARACTVCAPRLPLGPRPILRVSETARILIASQAPGTRAHESGIPFEDASGARLRDWLGLDRDVFHDESRVAILPQGFCYPGRLPRGGDAPPRPECAPLWQARLLAPMRGLRLILPIGAHAIRYHLGARAKPTLAATVAGFRDYLPRHLPLPHPSWRTLAWAGRNPWFEAEVIPALRAAVAAALREET
ncbi:uracil-DNA glycosylase family protein [Roseomonas sp. NAR14]|uniref:Uracil-DNA glycosylase family protein n=1 Tax=Roseomonas acroporae TaxID=2937791 RepID=A0A9X1Y834_9PROT|nr:uracil-DNA glycosylase family protein [Roseomonas acroporae]MCK8783950.1 uracil-DNA glycosylase family protein [Roseomonas acroporae]